MSAAPLIGAEAVSTADVFCSYSAGGRVGSVAAWQQVVLTSVRVSATRLAHRHRQSPRGVGRACGQQGSNGRQKC